MRQNIKNKSYHKVKFGYDINFEMRVLSPNDKELLGDFDCGNEVINDFAINKINQQSDYVTYVFEDTDVNKIIAFASLACSSIKYECQNVVQSLPAIEIKYFAIKKQLQKFKYGEDDDHFYFSDMILSKIILKCREISEKIVGANYIILYSVPDAVKFYTRNFFKDYSEYMLKDNISFLDGCKPMYMPL